MVSRQTAWQSRQSLMQSCMVAMAISSRLQMPREGKTTAQGRGSRGTGSTRGSINKEAAEKYHRRGKAEQGTHSVKAGPSLDQGAALRPCFLGRGRHQRLVGRHDGDHGVRPIGEEQDGAAEPGVAAGLPKGDGAERRADQRKRRLHGETAG